MILSNIIHRFLSSANTVLHLVSQSVYLLFSFLIALSRTCSTLLGRGGENKINKVDKSLAKLNKGKKRTQVRNERGDVTNDATKIRRINLKAISSFCEHKMPFLRNWEQS